MSGRHPLAATSRFFFSKRFIKDFASLSKLFSYTFKKDEEYIVINHDLN